MCSAAQTSLLISGSRRSIYTEVNFSLHPDILTENKTSEMGQTPPACSRSSHITYSCVERREIILFFPPKRRVNCRASIIMRSITLLYRVLRLHSRSIFLTVLFEVFAAPFPEPFCYLSLTSRRYVPDKNTPRGWNMVQKKSVILWRRSESNVLEATQNKNVSYFFFLL